MSVWIPRTSLRYSASRLIVLSHRPPLTRNSRLLYPPLINPHRYQSTTPPKPEHPPAEVKSSPPATKDPQQPLSTRVWKKVKHELQHYWHGTKLLVSEVRISSKLQWKILQGETLTRRERRQVWLLLLLAQRT
jgi:LETM1 and EF-hand domain-containing protein 1, mitochondrial